MRPLAVVGNVNVDIVVGPVTPWPKPGTEIFVDEDALRPGGAAGNTALAWAALDVPHQIGANVGDDQFGRYLGEAFGAAALRWPVAPESTTLSIGITHPDDERTFVTTRGHLTSLTAGQVRAMLDSDALHDGILLLCGCFLMPALAAGYDELFDWADANSIEVALDTGWPPDDWTAETVALTRSWLARCRYSLFNEAEMAALSGIADVEGAAEAVASLMPAGSIVVVKRGAEGALARTAAGAFIHRPAKAVRVIDTVGAGDIFNAGFLMATADGRPLEEALDFGIETAAAAISTQPRRYARKAELLKEA